MKTASMLKKKMVTGAKPVARIEIFLAPTRGRSIQPDCEVLV
jgi:hypothetical protein